MYPVKNPEVDLKLGYIKTIELGLIVSLILHIGFFRLLPEIDLTDDIGKTTNIEIEVKDIPPTEQVHNVAPPPPRPSVPIPVESEEIPEDLTIESTELNLELSELPPPPPQKEDDAYDEYVFIPYDEPPVPIGGYTAIHENLKYPEIARKVGIEGSVVIGVLIDEHGTPIKTQILKSSGTRVGLEDAATKAVMSVKWKPAKQRDRPIKVWVSVPVRFELKGPENVTS